jgi:hypothetical protein
VRLFERFVGEFLVQAEHERVGDDAAAHVSGDHEGEAAEHPLFADVEVVAEYCSDACCDFLVVGHGQVWMVRGSPNARKTLVSAKPVIAVSWSPVRVSTISP